MGVAVAGTGKPLIITSGTGMGSKVPGGLATEDHVDWTNPNPRIASERAAAAVSELGASVAVVRLPQVHNREKHGLVSRSEEHTSELQSLMCISYAVFCLKKKNQKL